VAVRNHMINLHGVAEPDKHIKIKYFFQWAVWRDAGCEEQRMPAE